MNTGRTHTDVGGPERDLPPESIGEGIAQTPEAWERIANGRYMPRRIRGSCPGRELG